MKPLLLRSLFSKLRVNLKRAIEEWQYDRSWRAEFVEVLPENPEYENAMYQEVIITGRPFEEFGAVVTPKRFNLRNK